MKDEVKAARVAAQAVRVLSVPPAAWAIWGVILWASLYLKRHTLPQLLAGTGICALSLGIAYLLWM